jgi:phosphate butyryltransferase
MVLNSLSQVLEKSKTCKNKKLAVAAAEDLDVLEAVQKAFSEGIITPILIGDIRKIVSQSSLINFNTVQFEIIDEPNPKDAAIKAVRLINEGRAEILMKGMVTTKDLLKAVLDKNGLRKSELISHVAIFQIPNYHKCIAVTDAAINIKPDLQEKHSILNNALQFMHKLGYDNPKVGIVAPVEYVNPKVESTIHAAALSSLNKDGIINNCIIEGPLALDNILSVEAANKKGINSKISGDVDLIVVPELDAGNILYKSLVYLAGGIVAANVVGASVPIVLTSRADSDITKLYSIALAVSID